MCMVAHAHALEQLLRTLLRFGLAVAFDFARGETDVLQDCHVGEQVETLKNHPHLAA
ncbi:hypothetical protein D3C75_1301970 [compost metagenome]